MAVRRVVTATLPAELADHASPVWRDSALFLGWMTANLPPAAVPTGTRAAELVATGWASAFSFARTAWGESRGLRGHELTNAGSPPESSLERLAARSGHDLPLSQAARRLASD